jgi:uncharacterized protein (DUF983 family)
MRPSPRVRCQACEFAWYGSTAAHGLKVIGSCTRCGGDLEFLRAPDDPEVARAVPDVAPAAVLGVPVSWAAR